jgi:hypothetical protein
MRYVNGLPIPCTTVELSVHITDEMVEDIIDGAGYAIGYWASKAVFDSEAQTYEVTEDEDDHRYVITYEAIRTALVKLVKGEVSIRSDIRDAITLDMIDRDGCRMDGECYDVIIQVACLGDVIYG